MPFFIGHGNSRIAYRKYLSVGPKRMFDTHGRGNLVAKSLLGIEYNDPGSEVRVSIPLEN